MYKGVKKEKETEPEKIKLKNITIVYEIIMNGSC